MNLYHSPHSGIFGYELGDTSITVYFKNGNAYVYTYFRPGQEHVEHMKELALAGAGLNTYISKFVQGNYDRKA